jgi:hypothetical protein
MINKINKTKTIIKLINTYVYGDLLVVPCSIEPLAAVGHPPVVIDDHLKR